MAYRGARQLVTTGSAVPGGYIYAPLDLCDFDRTHRSNIDAEIFTAERETGAPRWGKQEGCWVREASIKDCAESSRPPCLRHSSVLAMLFLFAYEIAKNPRDVHVIGLLLFSALSQNSGS